jgi:hypothetical protein
MPLALCPSCCCEDRAGSSSAGGQSSSASRYYYRARAKWTCATCVDKALKRDYAAKQRKDRAPHAHLVHGWIRVDGDLLGWLYNVNKEASHARLEALDELGMLRTRGSETRTIHYTKVSYGYIDLLQCAHDRPDMRQLLSVGQCQNVLETPQEVEEREPGWRVVYLPL